MIIVPLHRHLLHVTSTLEKSLPALNSLIGQHLHVSSILMRSAMTHGRLFLEKMNFWRYIDHGSNHEILTICWMGMSIWRIG